MKNLDLFDVVTHKINKEHEELFSGCPCVYHAGFVYIIKNRELVYFNLEKNRGTILHTFAVEDEINGLIRFKVLNNQGAVGIATTSSLIYFDNTLGPCVMKLDKVIVAAEWEPTGNSVAVVLADGGIFIAGINRSIYTWIVQTSTSLDSGSNSLVSLGWGSELTQFQGRKTQQNYEFVGASPDEISRMPNITWKATGEVFAVNYSKNSKRVVKVISNNCTPLYDSLESLGLMSQISFKPDSNIMASISNTSEGYIVTIFEENLHYRALFPIPDVSGEIKTFMFHPKFYMFLVHFVSLEGEQFINIYSMSNYHWSLKQQLHYKHNHKIVHVNWVESNSATLVRLVVLTEKYGQLFTYRQFVHHTTTTVGVIRGKSLDLTNFNGKKLPPPLFEKSIIISNPILLVKFHNTDRVCMIVDNQFEVYIVDFSEEPITKFRFNLGCNMSEFYPICWWDGNTVNFTLKTEENVIMPLEDNMYKVQFHGFEMTPLEHWIPYDHMAEFHPGRTFMREDKSASITYLTGKYIKQCLYPFYLDTQNMLYAADKCIARDITSFRLYNDYLVATRLPKALSIVPLNRIFAHGQPVEVVEFSERRCEEGSQIVCVDPSNGQIILQMPRGNLETITSRLILIDLIKKFLEINDWGQAINCIRTERLDWNLLIELDMARFVAHVNDFMVAATKINLLNTISLSFTSEYIVQKIYGGNIEISSVKPNKEEAINKLINGLHKTVSENFSLLCLMVSKHVSLRSGLSYVFRQWKSATDDRENILEICRQTLLKLIQENLTDVNLLYNVSYTFNNFEFVQYVASIVQLDPRIYEAEIQVVIDKPTVVQQRFLMCEKANNQELAVTYLIRCTDVYTPEFVCNYIEKHNMYSFAYKICKPDIPFWEMISRQYANYLSVQGKHLQAGMVLKRIQAWEEALQEFVQAINVAHVQMLLGRVNYTREQRIAVIIALAEGLLRANRVNEAVHLYETTIKDYEGIVRIYLSRKYFEEALGFADKYDLIVLKNDLIYPEIISYTRLIRARVISIKREFINYNLRLHTIRNRREMSGAYNECLQQDDVDDLVSDFGSVSTNTSRQSGSSTSSARSRRKEEKKKIDLRPGGPYEDIAIMRHLYNLIVEAHEIGKEVHKLCMLSEDVSTANCCRLMHEHLKSTLLIMPLSFPHIWPKVIHENPNSLIPEDKAILLNIPHLDEQYRSPPPMALLESAFDWKLTDIF